MNSSTLNIDVHKTQEIYDCQIVHIHASGIISRDEIHELGKLSPYFNFPKEYINKEQGISE